MAKSKLRKSYEKPSFQAFITIWVTFCVIFVMIPLYITIINSVKTHDEITSSIFAWTKQGLFSNMLSNYKMALLGTEIKMGLYEPYCCL